MPTACAPTSPAIDLAGGGAIFEPVGRNTAAAVAIATLQTLRRYGDGIVLVVPSDHEISTERQFWETIETGVAAAQAGRLVVFGIKPSQPETGYGYIEVSGGEGRRPRRLALRREAGPRRPRRAYLAAGNFYWNTGIFLFRASAMRDAFEKLQPDIWQAAEAAYAGGDAAT